MHDRRLVVEAAARKASLRLLKGFFRGQLTNDEYEEAEDNLSSRDNACWHAYSFVWGFYSDFEEVRMDSPLFDRETRRAIARWRLYLAADREPFPNFPGFWVRWFRRYDSDRALEHYPFRDEAHLKRTEARYLAGC